MSSTSPRSLVAMDEAVLQRAADRLRAVAHPLRLRIIELLADGELCVGELIDQLDTKQAVISQQLALLRDKGVVARRRDGSHVYYHLVNPHVIRVLECIRDHCES